MKSFVFIMEAYGRQGRMPLNGKGNPHLHESPVDKSRDTQNPGHRTSGVSSCVLLRAD